MTNHRLKLHIDRNIPEDPGIVATQTITLRERLMRLLLGRRRQITLVVPGDTVSQIDITESDDDLMALADAVKRHPAGRKLHRAGGDAA
ncbi:hypothetical protein [Rothia aeria]|jgi:hypothetical protein|uniref:hypothetical protein n=1 Tax=Rothia aeria TaxID=172042 RepID=UPI0028F1362B|nr:hypothetical protein [Rothia aeria]